MSVVKAFENEYISRRAAIAARGRTCNDNCLECDFAMQGDSWCSGAVFVVDLLRIPAADVRPVVLCRDCKRYAGRPWENNETGICARTDCGVGEDDFCSYGEKREES